ncbi:BlaI/MecI/CopY family transcriptional regulator [Aquimarina sp. MMG015]|uniref:BlaI/MecI/CopY family transcriptional regulator n=1 Tax=Aquimarina TaxID=290174 RepID=UPI000401E840|nr:MULTISPECIES: BlaI/MecI/CopY family transcriptional regulator [Aquimarina]AXT56018.1 BlaI/MecI/CopY family transcriptional regulator [Aquimarina sp. AD1]MBQ4803896.1 BlaI/MecI/CopY family transcriptional regulator [Aquimarina sp. MMG015]RKN37314.1 BlaI/MecI/CopY family transcriptional regulator [Aquimarina sp. AD1]
MKDLTKAEEQIMRYLWKLEKAFLKDIVEQFPEPRPAYTTISTVIRTLVTKKFISFNTYGRIKEYYPLISKEVYFKNHFKGVVKNFFSGSISKFAMFFTNDEDLNVKELENMKQFIEEKIEKLKKENE